MLNLYIENEEELKELIKDYQSIKNEITELETEKKVKDFQLNMKNAIKEFEEYFKSEEGKREICLKYNLYAGYYNGTFETEETLLKEFYLGRKEAIKEKFYDELDDVDKLNYQTLLNLKEKKFECELAFTDAKYDLDMSDEVFEKYKVMFTS